MQLQMTTADATGTDRNGSRASNLHQRGFVSVPSYTLCCWASSALPANLIFLVLLQYTELGSGQVRGLAEIPDLLLDKHEALEAKKSVVLIGVPGVHMLVKFTWTTTHSLGKAVTQHQLPQLSCGAATAPADAITAMQSQSLAARQTTRLIQKTED